MLHVLNPIPIFVGKNNPDSYLNNKNMREVTLLEKSDPIF
jgi:hypothetical protein